MGSMFRLQTPTISKPLKTLSNNEKDAQGHQRPVYLIGSRNNTITSIFIKAARSQNVKLDGIFFLGDGTLLIKAMLASYLHFRWRLAYILADNAIKTSNLTFDVEGMDDAKLMDVFQECKGGIFIVCGCNRILRAVHLKSGTFINYHNSLLPAHKGVASIHWAVYCGDPIGYTFHAMTKDIDEGDYYLQDTLELKGKYNWHTVSERLAERAASRLTELIGMVIHKQEVDRSHFSEANASVISPSYHSRKDLVRTLNVDSDPAEEVTRKAYGFQRVSVTFEGQTVYLRHAVVVSEEFAKRPSTKMSNVIVQNQLGVVIAAPVIANPSLALQRIWIWMLSFYGGRRS